MKNLSYDTFISPDGIFKSAFISLSRKFYITYESSNSSCEIMHLFTITYFIDQFDKKIILHFFDKIDFNRTVI